jgi:hypothetical protein
MYQGMSLLYVIMHTDRCSTANSRNRISGPAGVPSPYTCVPIIRCRLSNPRLTVNRRKMASLSIRLRQYLAASRVYEVHN